MLIRQRGEGVFFDVGYQKEEYRKPKGYQVTPKKYPQVVLNLGKNFNMWLIIFIFKK